MASEIPLSQMPAASARASWLERDRSAVIAAVVLAAIAIPCILAPLAAPYDPIAQPAILELQNKAPSLSHPLGTDGFSRDVLSRLMYGGRLSLSVAIVATLVSITLGTAYGAAAGYARGIGASVLPCSRCIAVDTACPAAHRRIRDMAGD